MVMLKKSVRHSSDSCLGQERARPTLPDRLSAPAALSVPASLREEKHCFAWQDGSSQTWRSTGFTALWQSPSHHRPPLHPQASAPQSLRLYPQLLVTSDCTASLKHTAFPEPLEKKAFPCEMARSCLPSDSPFHYYLFFLQQLPSKLRQHIQTANISTIH